MRYLLLLALFCSTGSIAQTRVFKGRVVDKDKNGVPFAVVEAKGMHAGVYCDENGAFAFTGNADSIKTLVISCLGFEKKEMTTEIFPLDSVLIELKTKVSALKEVEITLNKGKLTTGYLGKSRKHMSYIGDCYRFYGSETAIKLRANPEKNGMLKEVYVYITDDGRYDTKFRVHIYKWDDLPTTEITDSNVIVQAEEGNSWVKVDLSKKKIPLGEGLFVSVEWVSGFGNVEQPLQSGKNPDVTGYNGQVLGLTSDYGKPSKTYSRKPFSDKWIYYDAPDAQRHGGYFLNPMIYCTYTYRKE